MSDEAVRKLLSDSVLLLRRDGWKRGGGGPPSFAETGQRCALNAVGHAHSVMTTTDNPIADWVVLHRANEALRQQVEQNPNEKWDSRTVAHFNDHIAKSREDVIALFDKAIAAPIPVRKEFKKDE